LNDLAPVVITLTPAQGALLREALGKRVNKLRIEPQATASGWLYAARGGKEFWILKHHDPKSYLAAMRKHLPHIDPHIAKFRLRVGNSRIHRFGVYAEERIPARRDVIEYTGEHVNPAEGYRRTKTVKRAYVFGLNAFWGVDPLVGGSGAEFINHSCEPNLRWRVCDGHVYCRSLRAIEVGEELTIDYHFPKQAPKVRCRCGSPNCRGTINVVKKKPQTRGTSAMPKSQRP